MLSYNPAFFFTQFSLGVKSFLKKGEISNISSSLKFSKLQSFAANWYCVEECV